MKFSIEKTQLLQALQAVSKTVPTRTTLPILSCALFEVSGNKLIIKSTNLEIFISTELDIEEAQKGRVAIPVSTLLEITSAMPDEYLHFEVSDIGKINLKSNCGKYTIMGQSPDEFPSDPAFKTHEKITLSSENLNSIINNTIYAASKDELKPVLQGVLFNIGNNNFTAVATDGHRLVRLTRSDIQTESFEGSVVIPVKFLSLLKNQLKDATEVELKISDNHIQVQLPNTKISSRIIKDKYPDYESVIPKNNNNIVTINRNELTDSVKRVSIFSNKSTRQIALSIDKNKMTVSTEDPENITTGKEEVRCVYNGDPMIIGYNAQYLNEVLKNQTTEEIQLLLNTPLNAGIFLPTEQQPKENKTTLLMPIRLND